MKISQRIIIFSLNLMVGSVCASAQAPDLVKSPAGGYVPTMSLEQAQSKNLTAESTVPAQEKMTGLPIPNESPLSPLDPEIQAVNDVVNQNPDLKSWLDQLTNEQRNYFYQMAGQFYLSLTGDHQQPLPSQSNAPDLAAMLNDLLSQWQSSSHSPSSTVAAGWKQRIDQVARVVAKTALEPTEEKIKETYQTALEKTNADNLHVDIERYRALSSKGDSMLHKQPLAEASSSRPVSSEDQDLLAILKQTAAAMTVLSPGEDMHPFLKMMVYRVNSKWIAWIRELRAQVSASSNISQSNRPKVRSSDHQDSNIQIANKILKKPIQGNYDAAYDPTKPATEDLPFLKLVQ